MTQYLLLIQNNAKTTPTSEEWETFFTTARVSGMFSGGSALGERFVIGDAQSSQSTHHIGGFMRFDSDDETALLELLKQHPVVLHGGSVELCEMPNT